ncbi:MAG: peptidase S16 [Comamonadaceae bacterium]|nr:MAG: peptidase S16 [Comamonadaceae bacterium]
MTEHSLLHALPLFPLGAVLFPGGVLPLRIFEVRYLDMIGRCHKAGAPFGIVQLTQGSEVRVAGAPTETFASVGTLAMIREFSAPQAGLLQIECVGTQRFRLGGGLQQKHGLWSADVDLLPDDMAVDVPPDLAHTAEAMRRLVDALEERRAGEGGEAVRLPIDKPYRFDDCGWLANRWSELMPLPDALKQQLMTLDSPLMRLELVSDLLARTGIVE